MGDEKTQFDIQNINKTIEKTNKTTNKTALQDTVHRLTLAGTTWTHKILVIDILIPFHNHLYNKRFLKKLFSKIIIFYFIIGTQ